jgi:hypothetical protein
MASRDCPAAGNASNSLCVAWATSATGKLPAALKEFKMSTRRLFYLLILFVLIIVTEQPVATQALIKAATETAVPATNPPKPTATQVVLGVVAGTIAFHSHRAARADEIWVMSGDGSGLLRLLPFAASAMAMMRSM